MVVSEEFGGFRQSVTLEALDNCAEIVLFNALRLCGRVEENYGMWVTGFKVCCSLKKPLKFSCMSCSTEGAGSPQVGRSVT